MSSLREKYLGTSNTTSTNTSLRQKYGLEKNSKYYKNIYEDELKKQKGIRKDIDTNFANQGVQTNTGYFTTQRNILPVQQQTEITKNKKFEVYDNALQKNKEIEKNFQNIKNSDEYKKQEKNLIEQSNKVAFSKYDYDKAVVDEDNIGWYDKSLGTVIQGAKSVFDISGGLVKNENGDNYFLPNKTELKQQKVQDSYDTKFGKLLGNVGYEIGRIGTTTAINQVLPGVGSSIYFGRMFMDSTNNAISEGYDSGSATVYGLINVGLEYATGKMLGSATKGLTGGKTSSYEKLLNKTFSKVIKKPKIASILANAGSEATEEFIQEYLDNLTKLAVLEKSTDIKDYGSVFTNEDILADALYSAAIGGVTGGVIGTMSGENTNVDNNDVNLYDTFKKELEETKENTTNKDTINKIDTIISSIDSNINNDSNVDTIISQINEYEALKEQNKITKEQEVELNNLKEQLNAIQNQNTDTSTSSKAEVNLPTVQDIVNQKKSSQNSVNLPAYNQQSNITNSDKAILPTVNDFNSSNINMPTSNIKVDIAKIKPEILEDIKGFKLGDPNIESYKGSYIKTMLNEVGIKVPTAMNYVTEVRPDMSFTTTKDLTRQQYSSISNALQKLKSIDVTSVNNANYSIPIGNYQFIRSNNSNINELRRSASMYLNNTAKTNNTIRLLENIIKDRNYIIRFNPNITNEQGISVNGKISIENGKTVIELNPNADNYVEFLVIHEITHDIATKEMKELILDYAEQDPEFEKSLESLKERYKTDDVSDEVVADVCGELFGNREFIQSVVEKKPNIFKKILNNIRKLAEKIKGTRANEYVSFVEKLKTMWEEAYYSNRSNLSETKYSTIGIKGAKNLEINSNERRYNRLYAYLKTAKDIADQNKGKSLETRNIETKKQTQWYQTKYGDWATIISDKDSKLTKKLYPNKTYKLGEILKHDLLYKAYPGLEKLRVKTVDSINATGAFESIKGLPTNTLTTDILLKNSDINKKDFRKTILHEVNHFIEGYEKFNKNSRGANHGNMTIDEYRNNLGEIISNETKILADLTQDELDNIILFEQGKTNPQDKNIRKVIDLSNKMDKRSGQNNNINSAGYSGQNKVQMVSQNNIKNNKDNILKKLFHDEELENSSFSNNHKQKQLDIIKSNNPVNDDYHTWIRNVEDIKTLEETINDSDWSDYDEYNPDLSRQDIENAIDSGKIMVYSSYPIKQGVFVSPSKMEAESYSSNGKVYSKEVNINDVAWIDPTQGQYAKVYDILPTKYSQNTKEWNDYLKENFPSSGTKTKMSDIKLPVREDIESSSKKSKILSPNEISKLTKEDANTTPILPKRGSINKVNDGNSHFAKNIKDKVNMLNADQKIEILSKEDVRYYDKVTNKESLEKAFKKINDGGSSESSRWFNTKAKDMDATDVAEGWILLKQYADNGDYGSMVEAAKKMREIGTTAGQTVQAFNIMERMTPEGMVKYAQSELSEAYDRMVKNKSKEWIDKYREDFDLKPNEVKFIMDTMQEVQNMEDGYDKRVKLAEIQKLMTDKLPPEKGAKIRSWMRISMLFNPKTQVRNVAGNALIMPVNSFSDLFSSYADKLIAKKTGVRTTGTTNVKAMLKGIKKGAYEATNDYKKGINTKDMEGNRFEISDGKSFSEKNLMGRTLNRTESLLNYVMDVGDRVFSEAAFENSLQNQLVLNNTTEITQEMIDIAHQEALSRTWNDNNNYTRFVLNARAGLNKLVSFRGYGLGDVLIPFAKTPANLTKAIVDYSPAGLVSAINKGINLKKSLTNGQYTAAMQHEFVQNLGKATAGTMLYILGIALAKAGITSGDSDDDKDTANFLKNTLGISSYSIKIGGKSFTYDWAQPLAAPLSITANIVNKKYQNKDDKELLSLIIDSLDTGGSILLEQSFLQSINDVLNDNDGVAHGIIKEVLELPARAVPTFAKQIADLVDGTQRTSFEYGKPIQSSINSIKAKIPFVSKTLAPSVDTMGREIKKYGGKNNIFNVFFNPANVNTENISKSAEEIYRLYKSTGETNIMPRVAPYYVNQNGEKITLNSEQRAKYQKISGEIIENNVEKLLETSEYNNMSDKEKAEVIKNIVNYSYNIAQKEILDIELSNTYQKAYEYSQIGDISDFYTFKASIDDTDKDTKKESITNYLINCNLKDNQIALLYGSYYSSEAVLNSLINANIPIKEFIKFNSQEFTTDYYDNGKAITNSRKNKVINYVNNLNLTIPQKAMLIKLEYSSYTGYDNQIVNYINNMKYSKFEKASILKSFGFDNYDKYLIDYVNKMSKTKEEKAEILEELGFKVRNGRVYTK